MGGPDGLDILWVAESARRQGLGKAMLGAAEFEAVRRGCTRAHLNTHDFQAPDFYRKQGYQVFGELRDQPKGHSRFYFAKLLSTE